MNDILPIDDSRRFHYRDNAPRPKDGPIVLPELFPHALQSGAVADLEVDIGFGRGRSVFARAERNPQAQLLAIEVKTKWAYKVAERVERAGLSPRVVVWAGDAREILARSGPDGCVSRMYVHFPDPWWKKRHAGRLVVAESFAADAARLLRTGGEVFVQTDVEDRAQEYKKTLADAGFATEWVTSNPFGSVSNREVRSEEDGLPVYRLLATRN